jgi:putrescine transport system permease protein
MSMMVFGYAFLYIPILSLIIFSFNASRQSHTWVGFSTKWYYALFANESILKAAYLSLKIAFMSANVAVLIGTVAALALIRFRSFKGKSFFNSIVTAPLVMPDVMTGLALLLLFVTFEQAFGWPQRGMTTITIGHITISIAYVLVIIRTRLAELDKHLEEAALDLGARPLTVFFRITLPIISPSIAAGWLLAFTLSLDDVILANFLSGPGATTLPMLIFSSVRFGVNPQINALASIIVFLVAIGVMIGGFLMYRRGSYKLQD